ncbi:hypothetical protein E4T44_05085 [Aureobasidium sp. EXF-8845]|nr:hypothetical protein E4T44_05085 [Aureobasidium sp. EXF-8845]KAI4851278.1 hypothetical protein E4T45_05149 [Aureobasidium sp. EXF-8846]
MNPSILAIFGQPQLSIDLSASNTAYCNSVVIAAFGLDDMIGLFALAFRLLTMVLIILGGQYGSGKHVWSLQMTGLKMIFKVLYCYTFIYGAATTATKLSFVFSFARIFDTGIPVRYAGLKNYTRIAVWVEAPWCALTQLWSGVLFLESAHRFVTFETNVQNLVMAPVSIQHYFPSSQVSSTFLTTLSYYSFQFRAC